MTWKISNSRLLREQLIKHNDTGHMSDEFAGLLLSWLATQGLENHGRMLLEHDCLNKLFVKWQAHMMSELDDGDGSCYDGWGDAVCNMSDGVRGERSGFYRIIYNLYVALESVQDGNFSLTEPTQTTSLTETFTSTRH